MIELVISRVFVHSSSRCRLESRLICSLMAVGDSMSVNGSKKLAEAQSEGFSNWYDDVVQNLQQDEDASGNGFSC